MMPLRLVPFEPEDGPLVATWIRNPDEAALWASIASLPDAVLLARWHRQPDVIPFVLREGARTVAYGELWEDRDADEAELARLVVDPSQRGRGVGRALAQALSAEAYARGFGEVWLRVVPSNVVALAAYANAGFRRARLEEEAVFNVGQPQPFLWLRHERTATSQPDR